ncbi:MAG TPA: hypothetical protein PKK10_11740 [Woeseiaceae bacterium]|nr:hypothetical protein [Woeseiaceae bacterium]
MATLVREKVDYRLLNNLSNLVICSCCLRAGKVTPVPQIIAKQRPITNLCADCRATNPGRGLRHKLGKLLHFPRKQVPAP